MISDVEHLLMHLLVICISSLEKMSIWVHYPFFNQVFGGFAIELYEFPICFGCYPLIRYMA